EAGSGTGGSWCLTPLDCGLLTLSPCGRGWLREAKTGEGLSPHRSLRDTIPHPTASWLTGGDALSHKGRGRINAHREAFFRQPHSAASAVAGSRSRSTTASEVRTRWVVPSWKRITVSTGMLRSPR